MAVFVLDRRKKPLMPCSAKRARLLLERGRARVHKLYPFTIRLVDRFQETSALQPIRVKLDPGSRTSGVAVVRENPEKDEARVLLLAEVEHRTDIRSKMEARRSYRRTRRSRKCRYRKPRFLNRKRPEGWLPPSLRSRVDNLTSWVDRLQRLAPVTALSVESVRFDTQKIQNPEISGVEYQQGDLLGYEIREYLLEKWGRHCAYCGKKNTPLEVEHIVPRASGGSNRASNLTLACKPCNQEKDAQPVEIFLSHDPKRLARILAHAKAPLKDAAAVNSTRNALVRALQATSLPVETGTGGRTKYNRVQLGLPKTHAFDALAVGESTPSILLGTNAPVLTIRAKGRGCYQRHLRQPTRKNPAPVHRPREKLILGFQTGDMVRAIVAKGKYAGSYVAEIRPRRSGAADIFRGRTKLAQGISLRHCTVIQRADGYSYSLQPQTRIPPRTASRVSFAITL